ncbi:cGMP-dependent 3',5'-cyclic phosphodiesterase [Eumeta japonica]|uniref:3',5'-cyclic-GMP phosphodiesterase n=1 Tax=Eumeta variegata TaxID=151549 RepID=A0A4C1SAI5_EUMVA|nr:cGMP-dependent 3',5'-cyclic phosphodiesterase [Eumeta japonica]
MAKPLRRFSLIVLLSQLRDECEAELVVPVILNEDTRKASIWTVGGVALPRELKLCIPEKFTTLLRKKLPVSELLRDFDEDFQNLVAPVSNELTMAAYSSLSRHTIDIALPLQHLPHDDEKRRILIVPLIDKPFSILVCLIAPKPTEERAEVLVNECFLCCWPTLKKSIMFEYQRSITSKCQQLLRAARRLVTQQVSASNAHEVQYTSYVGNHRPATEPIEILLRSMIEQAKSLIHAECCTIFLVDGEAMELVERYPYEEDPHSVIRKKIVRRCSLTAGVAGLAARTGALLNVKAASEHPAFDPAVDGRPGCRSLLCLPIRERSGIIGVAQLIDKVGERFFNPTDEELALAFSIFCGLCIVRSIMHQKMREAHIRNALANEVVMAVLIIRRLPKRVRQTLPTTSCERCNGRKMSAGDRRARAIRPEGREGERRRSGRGVEMRMLHEYPNLYSLELNQREIPQREFACLIYRMFTNIGFDQIFNIHPRKLVRFILHVKKGYRDVPYHNWTHAFSVTHSAFAFIKTYELMDLGYLTELQALMYVIACLVHDMDHRGTVSVHMQTRELILQRDINF